MGGASADLREALVGPLKSVQVGGVVQVERRIGEPDNPPARRGTPCAREQSRVAGGVRKADGSCGRGRPVVEPPEVMWNLRCRVVPWEFERWQSVGRNM